jgi:hypothetical protein
MTASRTCRACWTELAPNVGWCLRCYEPVRHLTPREPQLPTIHFLAPRLRDEETRLRAGPTTFGLFGRIVLTIAIVWIPAILVPIFYLPLWAVVAIVMLKDVWRKERPMKTRANRRHS